MRLPATLLAAAATLLPCAAAAESPELPATPRSAIEFGPSTERAFDRSGDFVTLEQKPDGALNARQNGSFQNVSVARVGPGGKIETYCTTDAGRARDWMARLDGRPANVEAAPPASGDPK
ncbi:hypothetical protein [Elongatibacter sediminis]|uniref:Uncharacterized protein n=1 Tax=Elongatibacter sediminis TaxID=3119006 RepID=A0AAW9REF0_9GAMM